MLGPVGARTTAAILMETGRCEATMRGEQLMSRRTDDDPVSAVRTLPLTIAPVAGEALDSWLYAIAVRHGCSLNDLYHHLGLGSVRDLRTRLTAASLADEDAERMSAATGLTQAQVQSMTLPHFLASMAATRDATDPLATVPWHLTGGWRFCPYCLDASGGRWLLRWRLMWSFACLQHQCLLAERCPRCGRRQRAHPPINAVPPQPTRCAHPGPTGTGRSRRRCEADLADTPVTTLEVDHPALLAQQVLDELLFADTGRFGLYADHPTPVSDILADIRILGRSILSATAGRHLDDMLPADLVGLYGQRRQSNTTALPASVLTSATALTAAVALLAKPDLQSAAAPLAALPDDVSRYALHQQTYLALPTGPAASPVLQAVHLTARGDRLSPAEQLQCRLGGGFPRLYITNAQRQQRLLHALPTALWPGWSVRLTPPALMHSSSRVVLAAAALLVTSDLDVGDAADLLGGAVTRLNAVYLLWRFKESPCWPSIRDALTLLSDYVNDQGAPIDYQRRRRLDYSELLPQDEWNSTCRQLGRQTHPASHTRAYLQHRIAGTSQPFNDPAVDEVLGEFPRRLTPDLSRALHDYAVSFLAAQGVRDEPVVWEPPLSLVSGLALPGAEVADVDIDELHRMIRVDRRTIAATSQQLGVSADLIRVALEHDPAPERTPSPRTPRIGPSRPGKEYRRAVEALPRERLTKLYSGEQRSLADIAVLTGFSKPTISRLVRDYAIPRRRPGGRSATPIDPGWLRTEYIVNERSCADIARELHTRFETVAAAISNLGITVRTVTRHTEAELLAHPNVPTLLIPALVGHGGWERLQRYAVIAQFSTLTAAAEHLGRGVAVTGAHIARLEKDFGARLLDQRPLRCTEFGEDVLAAVHRLAEHGGP